jgi:hypothetical protein
MLRFRQIAAPAVLGIGLVVGVTGCAHDRNEVPTSAKMISSGKDELTATAPADGTVYIVDDKNDKPVYIGRVHRDDTISVDPKHDQILLDGKVATKRELWDDHKYQVFFDRDDRSGSTDDATVIRHRDDGSTVIQNGDKKTTVITPNSSTGDTVIKSDGTVVHPQSGSTDDKTIIRKQETVIENR